ncbi:HNH endonuclease family protein [Streptomyces sp. CB01635]|uniref:HNH endonuclease family protein n=1 Tax=unclassified Streptomyces TaxID=2593676 RepID=UPI0018FE36EB|nr:HNH endonuclease family protein [Streptomyces sp. CB01635]
MRTFARTAALFSAIAVLAIPTATTAQAAPGPFGSPGDVITTPLQYALKALPIADEDRTGYQRTSFKHWIDADKDGCNTRAEVLKAEAFMTPEQGLKCKLTGGRWYSEYDDQYIDGASGLDVDHRVPLAEAWDSGASRWTAAERQAYANDLGDDRALIAVSAKSNRSKADQDPATWMPPAASDHCDYLRDWIVVKVRWQLAIDPAEQSALSDDLAQCPNAPVKVTLAR